MNRNSYFMIATLIFGLVLGSAFVWTDYAHSAGQAHASNILQPAAGDAQRTISVSGSGQTQAQPDQATIRLGVQTQAESAEQALAENNSKIQSLLNALRQVGIAPADIQTQAIQLHPRYTEQPQQGVAQTLAGYTANNIVVVTVKNLDNLGELLDAAVNAGGNTIEGINLEISDSAALVDQAREAAMQDAKHKAEQLASLAGTSLGQVLTISETSNPPRPVAQASLAMADVQAVPIEPGT